MINPRSQHRDKRQHRPNRHTNTALNLHPPPRPDQHSVSPRIPDTPINSPDSAADDIDSGYATPSHFQPMFMPNNQLGDGSLSSPEEGWESLFGAG
jgi:hypothetical protein